MNQAPHNTQSEPEGSAPQGRAQNIEALGADEELQALGHETFLGLLRHRYTHNFTWLGRPIIQLPQDIVAMQEIVWAVQPDLIIETGIAHGGSLIFYASMLELIGGEGKVVGIDVDIREPNRVEIEKHRFYHRVLMLEGSSVSEETAAKVRAIAAGKQRILLVLDSNHTHQHVLDELRLYAPLVSKGSYAVVFDTVIEDMPADSFPDRPWGVGDNPMTAVAQYLQESDRFVVDNAISNKLMLSVAPGGYLKCVKG